MSSALLYNRTLTTSDARCRELFVVAYDSLGFTAPEAIRSGDYLFCGRYYLAWIDNTGFYGEVNGLWQLNGSDSDSLDFVYGPDGLVRNMLIAGENRDGRWADGYSGSIHIEILSHTPESNNAAEINDCATFGVGGACAAYALNEAGSFTRAGIPWWSNCTAGSPTFYDTFTPLTSTPFGAKGENQKFVFETRLTKEADTQPPYACTSPHADWLFPSTGIPGDGPRLPVYLQTGWELYGTLPWLVNTFKVRNGAGNPTIGGHAYVIHAAVATSLQHPPTGKEFRNWLKLRVPDQAGQRFRPMSDTDSGACRTVIPDHLGHPIAVG